MIGFYYTIQRNSFSNIELRPESFDSFTKITTPLENSLYLFSDQHASMENYHGYTFYIVGTLVYKNKWNRKALKLISDDLANGSAVKDIALNSKGQYCLVIHSPENVFIVTDKLGSFPVYKYEKNNLLRISNMLPLLAKLNDITLAFQELAEFISLPDSFCYGTTFFKEILPLRGGTIYNFSQKQTSKLLVRIYYNMFDNITFKKYQDLNEVADMVGEILTGNLTFFEPQDKIFADITAGFDTRVNATILSHNNIKCVAGIMGKQIPCDNQTLNEAEIARKVADKLNLNFDNDFCVQDYEQFKNLVCEHYNVFNGVPQLYYSSDLIGYYENIKAGYNIHLTGMLGTQLMCRKHSLEGMTIDNRINIDGFIRKSFGYKSIISNKYITESQYYDNLYDKVVGTIGTAPCDDPFSLLMLLVLDTYGRFHHGSAIGTHNCILPHYSPYIEADLLKVMFEASSSLKYDHNIQKQILAGFNSPAAWVLTSHGYRANVSSGLFSEKFLRVSRLARRMKCKSIDFLKSHLKVDSGDNTPKFWLRALDENYSDDAEIFDIIDKIKLENALQNSNDNSKNRLKAKIIYLNKIIEDYKPDISVQ